MSTRMAALCGLIATLLFPAAVIILNIVQAPPYDAVSQPASQLALGTGGWLMVVGFVGLAVGTLLVGLVLGRMLATFTTAPVVLLLVAGVLGFVPAVFPTDAQGAALTVHGLIHNLTGVVTFLLYVAAMITAVFRFKRSAFWQPLQGPTKIWAAAGVVAFVLIMALGKANLFGLTERIALAVFISWMITLVVRVIAADSEAAPADRAG